MGGLYFVMFVAEKYDSKLCHIVPTLVVMTEAVQDVLEKVCDAEMCGTLHYQVIQELLVVVRICILPYLL
jgi:hypothetical protein